MSRFFTALALSLALWHAPSATAASTLPEYYPDSYEIIGSLTGVNLQQRYIVILDIGLALDPAARVYTPLTKFETLDHLRPGMLVGIKRQRHTEPVTDIWVLPSDFQSGE